MYTRYIDDIFIISPSHVSTEYLLSRFNTLDPSIQLTADGGRRVSFLDLDIHIGRRFPKEGLLDYRVFTKDLNRYLYLPFSSFHTTATKKAFISGEILRLIRNSSTKRDFERSRESFFSNLCRRGYPPMFIGNAFRKYTYDDDRPKVLARLLRRHQSSEAMVEEDNLEDKETKKLVFLTTNNPVVYEIGLQHLLRDWFDKAPLPADLKQNLPPPIIGYRNAPSLGSYANRSRRREVSRFLSEETDE